MTTTTRDATPEPQISSAPRRRMARFDLSATQLVATALAAITATIAASYLGVSGTVVGAALASVVSAVGNAVYGHSLRTTSKRVRVDRVFLRERRQPGVGAAPREENVIVDGPPVSPEPARPPVSPEPARPPVLPPAKAHPETAWRRIAIGSIAAFVAVLAVVTGVEVVAGRPLSDLVRGNRGTGTSVFGTARGPAATSPAGTPHDTPTVTRTVTPAIVVTTPTVTQTAPAVTTTARPSRTATPSPPASETGASSGSRTAGSPSAP